jgi:hypothetical protein
VLIEIKIIDKSSEKINFIKSVVTIIIKNSKMFKRCLKKSNSKNLEKNLEKFQKKRVFKRSPNLIRGAKVELPSSKIFPWEINPR